MFSDKKSNLTVLEKNCQSHGINEEEGEGILDVCDLNKFSMHSDCVMTCQESSFLTVDEKRSEFLKLLERDPSEADIFKNQETNDSESDESDENKSVDLEEASESAIMQLPLEISKSDSEEDNNYQEWEHADENQCSLDSICGLTEIKETLFNILVYPSLYPHFFPRGIRWNQILLYGPPGTGKTMLAKALATEINATLHRISSADLLSHWQGHTEKQIRCLFQEIHANSEPKILFFDEIDGLFRRRTSEENDSTRRIKTELLNHLDDFTAEFEFHQTFLIGATNCPWEIDLSFMRRFHKKIFVPLPDRKARLDIIKKNFENIETDLSDLEWNTIADRTEGFSGSDLVNVVMTSCCERFMEIKKNKYWEARGDIWIPVSSCSVYSTEMNFEDIHPDQIGIRNIKFSDLLEAVTKTPKTVEPEALTKYLEFSEKK